MSEPETSKTKTSKTKTSKIKTSNNYPIIILHLISTWIRHGGGKANGKWIYNILSYFTIFDRIYQRLAGFQPGIELQLYTSYEPTGAMLSK